MEADPDFIEENEDKIEISLNAVAKAPKLKVQKFKIKRAHTFQHLINFVRGQLEKAQVLNPRDSLVMIALKVNIVIIVFVYSVNINNYFLIMKLLSLRGFINKKLNQDKCTGQEDFDTRKPKQLFFMMLERQI